MSDDQEWIDAGCPTMGSALAQIRELTGIAQQAKLDALAAEERLRIVEATHGARSLAQRAVLDACAAIPSEALHLKRDPKTWPVGWMSRLAQAELALRAAEDAGTAP